MTLDDRLRGLPGSRIAATAISGVLMWLAFPPVNAGVVVFVAPIPLLWALRTTTSAWRGAALGALFGAVFFTPTLSWFRGLGVVAWIPLVFLMMIGSTLCAAAIATGRSWAGHRWLIGATGWWALWEFTRARVPFGGFPWASAGHPVGTLPWPRGSAQWIGSTGWSVLVVGFAASVVLMVTESDRRPARLVGGAIVILTVLGGMFAPDPVGPDVRVAVIQGNSPCPGTHCPGERETIFETHLALTQQVAPGAVDLIVWGENSFGGSINPTYNPLVRSAMAAEARRTGAYLLVSGTRPAGPDHFDNINIVFHPTGRRIGEYMKRHPVPFGEYVPLRFLTAWIPQLDRVPRDMTRGEEVVVFDIDAADGAGRFGSVISFEGSFTRHLRSGVTAGAELMIVPTNEASFGYGAASDQLLGMVRMSAASLGVDVVVAAITGKSAIVRADGSIESATSLFEEVTIVDTVTLRQQGRTLYGLVGDWLQWLAILALAVVATRDRVIAWWERIPDIDDAVTPYRLGE